MKKLQEENEMLKIELQLANKKTEDLKEKLGAWRRKAEGHDPKSKQFVRQGFDSWKGVYYRVYVLEIPFELDFKEVIKEVYTFLHTIKPYGLGRIDYSERHKGYLVQAEKEVQWNFSDGIFHEDVEEVYKQTPLPPIFKK